MNFKFNVQIQGDNESLAKAICGIYALMAENYGLHYLEYFLKRNSLSEIVKIEEVK